MNGQKHCIINASAGTGKTYTLTQQIISCVKSGVPVGQILALTFTNAAAAEMRERIFDALNDALKEEKEEAKRTFLLEQKRAFSQNYISTFHAFSKRILGLFPEELAQITIKPSPESEQKVRLGSGFETIEGVEERHLMKEWQGRFAQTYKSSDWLKTCIMQKGLSSAWTSIELVESALSEEELETLAQMKPQEFGHFVIEEMPRLLEHMRPLHSELLEQSGELWLPEANDMDIFAFCENYLNKDGKINAKKINKKLENKDELKASLEQEFTLELKALDLFYERFQNVDDLLVEENSHPDWTRTHLFEYGEIAFCVVVQSLAKAALHWSTFKRFERVKRNQINFDDYQFFAKELLKIGSVSEKLSQRFRAILIDEFQDTDPIQWQLVEVFLKQGKAPITVVGDAKQAIYGFRGGDLGVFNHALRVLEAEGAKRQTLSDSYRSSRPVLAFVNAVFKQLFEEKPAFFQESQTYDKLFFPPSQAHPKEEQFIEGRVDWVDISPTISLTDLPAHDQTLLRVEGSSVLEAALIAQQLRQVLLDDAFEGEDRVAKKWMRGMYDSGKRTVGILLKNKSKMSAYLKVLHQAGIQAVAYGGGALHRSPEIMDAFTLIRFFDDSYDDFNTVALLRSPWLGLTDAGIFALRQLQKVARADCLWNYLLFDEGWKSLLTDFDQAPLLTMIPKLARWRQSIRERRLSEVLDEIYSNESIGFSYGDIRQAQVNLDTLFEQIQRLERLGRGDLSEILDFLDAEFDAGKEGAQEPGVLAEAPVEIMTMHAAKGLQFPWVFMAEMGNRPSYDSIKKTPSEFPFRWRGKAFRPFSLKVQTKEENCQPALYDYLKLRDDRRDWEDNKRLFYVACTRAQNQLTVLNFKTKALNPTTADSTFQKLFTKLPLSNMSEVHYRQLGLEEVSDLFSLLEQEWSVSNMKAVKEFEEGKRCRQEWLKQAALLQRRKDIKVRRPSGFGKEPTTDEAFGLEGKVHIGLPATEKGTIVHRAMELCWPNGKMEQALQEAVTDRVRRGLLPVSEREYAELQRHLTCAFRLMSSRFPKPERVLSEQAFETHLSFDWKGESQSGYFRGIIDLLVLSEGTWYIVDFKTNGLSGRSGRAIAEESAYFQQLALYRAATTKLCGRNVETQHCLLLFSDLEGEWVALSEA